MKLIRIIYSVFSFITILLLSTQTYSQTCTTLGQNPSTAFPVCGKDTFPQTQVPICGGANIPTPGCANNGLFTDKNPFWYKFTAFSGGTLGFLIRPNTLAEDYDWQLFDITNKSPNAVFSDPSCFVACNWSGEFGLTGASSAGTSLVRCDGPGVPLFSSMPTLITGHNYLLLISHFSNTQAGYQLSFGGGTANITDPTNPHILSAEGNCDGTQIRIRVNKKMKCNSLTATGSEFTLSPPVANIIAANGAGCNSSFDMDSVILTLNNPLPPGNYTVTINNGTDANSLLDNCDRNIPPGENASITILPLLPTPMDSLTKPGCAPDNLQLVFRKNIKCNSIAPDGSDFIITGSQPVSITGASCLILPGTGNSGQSKIITVSLSSPIYTQGNFTITLKRGTDGNTIIDECSTETPAGSSLPFSTKDTVNADFTYNILYGCQRDTVRYFHPAGNGVNTWKWTFDGSRTSTLQNPETYYTTFGTKQIQLFVSNGVCSDTSSQTLFLDNDIKSDFEVTQFVCPNDKAIFKNNSIGRNLRYFWDFGNGITSTAQTPLPQSYVTPAKSYDVVVRLTVTDDLGCTANSFEKITVVNSCYIAVPNAFTPNNDGLNDYLYPLNAYKAKNLKFKVYNRFGQVMFTTTNWLIQWDGTQKGQTAEMGTYVWVLEYINSDTGEKVFQKGTALLIR